MLELEERDLLLASLKGYLEELRESGVEELRFGMDETPAAVMAEGPAEASATPTEAATAALNGAGNPHSRLLFVMTGAGFAGESGSLLARIVVAMGFAPEDVFLLSFPGDAVGTEGLRRAVMARVSAVNPEVVVALGEGAAQLLLESREPLSSLRGRFKDLEGVRLMASLHPDQLLADDSLKREVWNEMKQVMAFLAKPGA